MVKARMYRYQCSCLGFATILVIWNFSVVSVQSYECPESDDLSDHVKFYLYSKFIPDRVELIPDNVTNLKNSGIHPEALTKFITHGFEESPGFCNSTGHIINAFKRFTDFNLILVDWSALSGRQATDYPLVVECLRSRIAKYLGSYVTFMTRHDAMYKENVHLIGFSLGAHLFGMAANHIQFYLPRLTGLDPAGPLFDYIASPKEKISGGKAQVVDVLHTNSLVFGTKGPDGTIDFYVDGGTEQTDCGHLSENLGQQPLNWWQLLTSAIEDLFDNSLTISECDHNRSFLMFARSIDPANEFPSSRCDSVEDARSHKCHGRTGYAGYYLRDTEPGIYFTNSTGHNFTNLET